MNHVFAFVTLSNAAASTGDACPPPAPLVQLARAPVPFDLVVDGPRIATIWLAPYGGELRVDSVGGPAALAEVPVDLGSVVDLPPMPRIYALSVAGIWEGSGDIPVSNIWEGSGDIPITSIYVIIDPVTGDTDVVFETGHELLPQLSLSSAGWSVAGQPPCDAAAEAFVQDVLSPHTPFALDALAAHIERLDAGPQLDAFRMLLRRAARP